MASSPASAAKGRGYRGSRALPPEQPGLLVVGRNPVCTDTVAAALMGYDPRAAAGQAAIQGVEGQVTGDYQKEHGDRPQYSDNILLLAEAAGLGSADLVADRRARRAVKDLVFDFEVAPIGSPTPSRQSSPVELAGVESSRRPLRRVRLPAARRVGQAPFVAAFAWFRHRQSARSCSATSTAPTRWGGRSRLRSTPDRASADDAAAAAAFVELRRLDRMLSHYRPESEWSDVNRHAAERAVKRAAGTVRPAVGGHRLQPAQRGRLRHHGRPIDEGMGFPRRDRPACVRR